MTHDTFRAIIAQLIYSAGASGFAGANGSMMIEVVVSSAFVLRVGVPPLMSSVKPFFHLIANSIADEVGEDNPRAIIATTMVAFAFSSILTGGFPLRLLRELTLNHASTDS